MTFDEILSQVLALLQREGRVSYRALKRRFGLDDDYLEDLKDELIKAKQLARDEAGAVLVWTGKETGEESGNRGIGESGKKPTTPSDSRPKTLDARPSDGERRQLTVQFIDLVGSTTLSHQLDPEDYHARVVAYQAACRRVIQRYDGHIAQYLGDGVLVHFGYPVAHEEDAVRAVRSGLDIVAAVGQLEETPPLRVRIGIHTGPVVVGEIGAGERMERLALGETPNIAARVQGQAEPNTVVISAATYRLVQGLFECHELGAQPVKGLSTPLALYRVVGEDAAQSRFEVAIRAGLTPLVGRDSELGVLRQRWEQAKAGAGQVVLVSGEPGIGKSRLVQELKEQLEQEGATRIEFCCSPYHQNSALHPIIDHLQRLLQFAREDAPATTLEKLQHLLSHYRFPQADTVPLLAALLSLPHPAGSPPITVSPQKQKEKTQAALVAWLVEEAEQQPVYSTWEDLHWADPSTLEVLHLVVDQVPSARLYVLLTFRPEFLPPWGNRSHLSQLTLSRLGHKQVREMVLYVAARASRPLRHGSGQASTSSGRTDREFGGQSLSVRAEPVEARAALPQELLDTLIARSDGVPLFVEELTKTVIESEVDVGARRAVPLPLAIPTTLHDSLMARLDRLNTTKEIAQLGATLGREFSYELLQAVSRLDEATLQQGLQQLVQAELVYQRGLAPQARYLFKHALIQDTAYQSLLKSTRQQYHRRIGQVLEEQFPDTKETQPELVAHHYTEAGLIAQAIPYWQKAGERASQRSAFVEAISHLTKGIELLKTLPETPERTQHELTLQIALWGSLIVTKGFAAPAVEQACTRALELCRQVGETPQLYSVLLGLSTFYMTRAEYKTAHNLQSQRLTLAQHLQDTGLLLQTHQGLGGCLFMCGEVVAALEHFDQAIAFYDPQQHHSVAFSKVYSQGVGAWALLALGYPDQAQKRNHAALTSARELPRPFERAYSLFHTAVFHLLRREGPAAQELSEEAITLATELGLSMILAWTTITRGWALAEQGEGEEGIAQMRQGLAVLRATGAELSRPTWLGAMAEACGKVGQVEEGLSLLAEALAAVHKTGECVSEVELYRLRGELALTQSSVQRLASSVQKEAEECFWKAIEVARRQNAKYWELRASTSLARLWQQQGKKDEARQMLAEIYGWFTEGFDTKDLQEAKALLDSLVPHVGNDSPVSAE